MVMRRKTSSTNIRTWVAKMLVGYNFCPQNQARFDFYEGAPDSVFCPACGDVVDQNYAPKDLKAKNIFFAAVFTSDGHDIASEKFKEFLDHIEVQDMDLIQVNEKPPLYDFQPRRIIPYDVECGPPRFENRCPTCGQYESVIGPTYSCLKGITAPIETGIYRTDLEFASNREKHPLIIAGVQTAELIKKERMRGLVLNPIDKDL